MSICQSLVFAAVLAAALLQGQTLAISPDAFSVPLDEEGLHTLHWTVDYEVQTVSLEAHFRVPADNWVALGFSDRGKITDADLCVLWAGEDGARTVEDSWTDKYGVLHRDQSQDCEGAGFEISYNLKKFRFTRKFKTSDQHDYVIEEGTTHVVWASGSGPLEQLDGVNVASAQHGLRRTDLLQNPRSIPLPLDTFTIPVVTENFKVPRTLYPMLWNTVIKLPDNFKRKHHVVKYEPILPSDDSKVNVHHINLYDCAVKPDKELKAFAGLRQNVPKELNGCRRPLAVWAPGGTAMHFPEEAGLPLGGPDANLNIVLEVHFENRELRDDLVITTGLKLYVTPTLREYDAGLVQLNAPVDSIPPGHPHFAINGHCSSACTNHSLPADGVTVFGAMLHTHAYGIRVVLRHVRNGQMLNDIARDNHYSTHHQKLRLFKRPVHVNPGDSMITTCVFDTTGVSKVTLEANVDRTDGEVCGVLAFYYPRTNLVTCLRDLPKNKLSSTYKLGKLQALPQPELYDSTEAIDESFIPVHPEDDVCLNLPKVSRTPVPVRNHIESPSVLTF